jgi:hypothetical protein
MLARGERKRLLAQAVELYSEGVEPTGRESAAAPDLPPPTQYLRELDEEQQAVIDDVRQMLAEILTIVSSRSMLPEPPPSAIVATVNGAEMVAQAEVLAGQDDWLTKLLPSFTYLTTLAFLDRALALELADRVRELADEAEREADG